LILIYWEFLFGETNLINDDKLLILNIKKIMKDFGVANFILVIKLKEIGKTVNYG
jgi:hypothetical protein